MLFEVGLACAQIHLELLILVLQSLNLFVSVHKFALHFSDEDLSFLDFRLQVLVYGGLLVEFVLLVPDLSLKLFVVLFDLLAVDGLSVRFMLQVL